MCDQVNVPPIQVDVKAVHTGGTFATFNPRPVHNYQSGRENPWFSEMIRGTRPPIPFESIYDTSSCKTFKLPKPELGFKDDTRYKK